jgi:hypothetical protein
VPVIGLFILMLLFSIAIGPVQLVLLTRSNRRIWMLWTVPLISAITCLAVLGYMIVAEGWQGHATVAGVTILDEGTHRATTIGRAAFYSPMTPGDGLRFRPETEVLPQGNEHPVYTASAAIDWTHGQHFSRGWGTARIPAHCTLRKSEVRRERLGIDRADDGTLSVRNALGVDIRDVWFADDRGVIHHGGPIPAGQAGTLQRTSEKAVAGWPARSWRELYTNTYWTRSQKLAREKPREHLAPGTYVAVVEGTPFLEQPLRRARLRATQSIVLGISDPKAK